MPFLREFAEIAPEEHALATSQGCWFCLLERIRYCGVCVHYDEQDEQALNGWDLLRVRWSLRVMFVYESTAASACIEQNEKNSFDKTEPFQ